jgi:hypothetical protein
LLSCVVVRKKIPFSRSRFFPNKKKVEQYSQLVRSKGGFRVLEGAFDPEIHQQSPNAKFDFTARSKPAAHRFNHLYFTTIQRALVLFRPFSTLSRTNSFRSASIRRTRRRRNSRRLEPIRKKSRQLSTAAPQRRWKNRPTSKDSQARPSRDFPPSLDASTKKKRRNRLSSPRTNTQSQLDGLACLAFRNRPARICLFPP